MKVRGKKNRNYFLKTVTARPRVLPFVPYWVQEMKATKSILYHCPQRTGTGLVIGYLPGMDNSCYTAQFSGAWMQHFSLTRLLTLGIPTEKADHLNSWSSTKTLISTSAGLNFNFQCRWLQPDATLRVHGTIVTSAGSTGSVGRYRL